MISRHLESGLGGQIERDVFVSGDAGRYQRRDQIRDQQAH
jgi:hypothetical protein